MDTVMAAVAGLLLPGFLVFVGFLVIFIKLKRRTALRWLAHPILIDCIAITIAFFMHGGDTFAGGMSATTAGILVSIATGAGRKTFGYISRGVYHPGIIKFDPRSLV